LLAGHGSTVTCGDVDLAGAAATAAHASEAGGIASGTQLDVTAEANWEETLREILQRNSRLDVLVNCAGISFGAPVTETSLEDWRRVMAVNLEGVFLGTKHAIVATRQTGCSGSIVNVSSASGIKASAGASAYSASKAAVGMFTKAVAKGVC
jgi:NAD(P)-dependent dehydrogenase (short-subunit alcohol dehydrogenase family)